MKTPLNKFAIYNQLMDELDELCVFDSITEANEFMAEHMLDRAVFIVVELKRIER